MADGTEARDRIFLHGYGREVEIGVLEEERGVRQRLMFDIELEVAAPAARDDVGEVVSYVTLVEAVEAVADGPRLDLVETFAERVAERCLADPRAARVHVRIAKLDRLAGGARFGVAITRPR
ncbi:MAG TPA: dihydroneopterin aldolase [Thermohalobaculum sp.]|nr:dihydroneopterin aldolase [Thermohalobaculum sp.]